MSRLVFLAGLQVVCAKMEMNVLTVGHSITKYIEFEPALKEAVVLSLNILNDACKDLTAFKNKCKRVDITTGTQLISNSK